MSSTSNKFDLFIIFTCYQWEENNQLFKMILLTIATYWIILYKK